MFKGTKFIINRQFTKVALEANKLVITRDAGMEEVPVVLLKQVYGSCGIRTCAIVSPKPCFLVRGDTNLGDSIANTVFSTLRNNAAQPSGAKNYRRLDRSGEALTALSMKSGFENLPVEDDSQSFLGRLEKTVFFRWVFLGYARKDGVFSAAFSRLRSKRAVCLLLKMLLNVQNP